jgi:hypothetical protein
MPYHRLLAAVLLTNVAVLVHHLYRGDWRIADGSALSALSALTLVNLTAAVLIRQQNVLNVLYGLAGRGSRDWPLWLRWSVSKVHHVGGIPRRRGPGRHGVARRVHVVAIVARTPQPEASRLRPWCSRCCLVVLALVVVACAAPRCAAARTTCSSCRTAFGGWTAIALFWALTAAPRARSPRRRRGGAGARVGLARVGAGAS